MPQNLKKEHFQKPERAELRVFRAQKCLQERFQGKFKSSFCGSQNSYKKFADLYTIQTEKIFKIRFGKKGFYSGFEGESRNFS